MRPACLDPAFLLGPVLRRGPALPRGAPLGFVSTGTDSPLSADSSTSSAAASPRRASAGMMSPSASTSRSPRTTSAAGTSCCALSRTTGATGAVSADRGRAERSGPRRRRELARRDAGETYESQTMYPTFAKRAKAAVDSQAAERFSHNAEDEAGHARALQQALDQLS
ncbi:ferritin family protein [Nonomuraea sp. B19D2]|uniref:ferritin family protein n=1 Tax=Nonomuraea sp. B19D2 TaxID=3159561 RepID=UPI0032DA2A1F